MATTVPHSGTSSPKYLPPASISPWEVSWLLPSGRLSNISFGSDSGSFHISAYTVVSKHVRIFHEPFKSSVSVSHSPVTPHTQAPLAFKARCPAGSSSWCRTPWLESQMWGSDLSLLVVILLFVGCPLGSVVLYCTASSQILPISL